MTYVSWGGGGGGYFCVQLTRQNNENSWLATEYSLLSVITQIICLNRDSVMR